MYFQPLIFRSVDPTSWLIRFFRLEEKSEFRRVDADALKPKESNRR